jgi:hypothetical protein
MEQNRQEMVDESRDHTRLAAGWIVLRRLLLPEKNASRRRNPDLVSRGAIESGLAFLSVVRKAQGFVEFLHSISERPIEGAKRTDTLLRCQRGRRQAVHKRQVVWQRISEEIRVILSLIELGGMAK